MANYKIQQGDTLAGIAQKQGTTLQNLLSLNKNITDPNKIQAGASLNLSPTATYTQQGTSVGGKFYANQGNSDSAFPSQAPIPTSTPIGIKTKSPSDNIKIPSNTTSQPQTQTPIGGASSTEGGTQNNAGQQQNTNYNPTNTGLYGQLVTDLANKSQQSGADYQNAQNEANKINQQIEDAKKQMAQQTSDINQSGTWTSRALGEQGQANIQNAATLAALGSQYQGATNQIGAANTQQGLLQQALQQAVGYAQPTSNIINVNPITGLPVAGGSLTGLAQTAGNIQGIQSGAATAAATQGGIQSQQAQQVAQYTSALQQGQNLQSQFTDLLNHFGLNPNDINVANLGIQKIAQNTSSPQYKILQNYINDIANTYAQILTPPGGSATDSTRAIATSMLDATASGQSLQAVMESLDQQAQAKIAGIPTQTTTTSNTGGGSITWDNFKI